MKLIREVEIDLTVETVEEAEEAQENAKVHGVRLHMIKADGPGGGWPVYRVSGPPDAVAAYLESVNYEEADH